MLTNFSINGQTILILQNLLVNTFNDLWLWPCTESWGWASRLLPSGKRVRQNRRSSQLSWSADRNLRSWDHCQSLQVKSVTLHLFCVMIRQQLPGLVHHNTYRCLQEVGVTSLWSGFHQNSGNFQKNTGTTWWVKLENKSNRFLFSAFLSLLFAQTDIQDPMETLQRCQLKNNYQIITLLQFFLYDWGLI